MEKYQKEITGNVYFLTENKYVKMKKVLIVIASVLVLSCSQKPVPKPDNLLSKEVMEEIIYDLAILQAVQSYKPQMLNENNIDVENYIYKKHKIDSATYYQNYKYYASDVKTFKKMYKHVNERILNEKSEIDTLMKRKNIELVEEVPSNNPQIK